MHAISLYSLHAEGEVLCSCQVSSDKKQEAARLETGERERERERARGEMGGDRQVLKLGNGRFSRAETLDGG